VSEQNRRANCYPALMKALVEIVERGTKQTGSRSFVVTSIVKVASDAIVAARSEPAEQGMGLEVRVKLPTENDTP